jgi:hypothetical protein
MLPEAFVSHSSAGRLRVKIPSNRKDDSFFLLMKESLSSLSGVDAVEVNSLTGSLLILHHLDPGAMIARIRERELFRLKELTTQGSTLRQEIARTFQSANEEVASFTGGRADLWDVVIFSLVGAVIYQAIKGNLMAPVWYTALWYAFNLFTKAQKTASPEE